MLLIKITIVLLGLVQPAFIVGQTEHDITITLDTFMLNDKTASEDDM